MILDILACILLFLLTTSIGVGVVPGKLKSHYTIGLPLYGLIGLTILCVNASWIVALNLDIKYFWVLVLIIFSLNFLKLKIFLSFALGFLRSIRNKFNEFAVFTGLAFFVSALHNPSFFTSFLSFRNGPDLVGWTSSILFFSENNKLHNLESRILNELNTTNFASTLAQPADLNQSFLYKISSFTEQVNAEFLLGAHRTGLPGFLGAVDNLTGSKFTFHVVVGFLSLIISIIFALTIAYLKSSGLSSIRSYLLALTGCLNLGVLSVMMEGGFGQIATLPYLVLLITIVVKKTTNHLEYCSVLILLTSFSLSTYIDFLYLVGPLSVVMFIKLWRLHEQFYRRSLMLFASYFCGGLISWPILPSLPRLFWERIFGHPGGWSMGRFPAPSDLFGILNWLPSDSVTIFQAQGSVIVFCIILSGYLIYFFSMRLNFDLAIVLFCFLAYYLLLVIFSYGLSVNNYPLFKAGAYFAVLVPFLLFGTQESIENGRRFSSNLKSKSIPRTSGKVIRNNRTQRARGNKKLQASTLSIVSAILLSSLNWINGWYDNRQFSISQDSSAILKPIVEGYDVVTYGFVGAGTAKLALLGDIRYVSNSRGFNVQTLRSYPERDLAFLFDKQICGSSKMCSINFLGIDRELKLLLTVRELDVYVDQDQ